MRVCVRKPHSRWKTIYRFRHRKTTKRRHRPRSAHEDDLERELERVFESGSSESGSSPSVLSEREYRYEELRDAVDPAEPGSFNPPLAAVNKVPGCHRCRLIGAALAWHEAHDEPDFKGNSPVYTLQRSQNDLRYGVLNQCWWCVRISASLSKRKMEGKKGEGMHLGRHYWPVTFQFLGRHRSIHIEAGHSFWWQKFKAWAFPTGQHLPFSREDGGASQSASFTSPAYDRNTGLCRELTDKLARNTDNPATWGYVKDRLENCARNHPDCSGSGDWLPSRLAEVVTLESAIRLRLVLTEEWAKRERYTTLSHTWGSNTTFKLTKKTYNELQQGISVEELPQKYIDAARATSELGVKYIWIDSLCIVQDDPEDWRQESAQMHLVYRHSFCNLSAASSVSPHQGLFFNRDPNRVVPYVLDRVEGTVRTIITQEGYDNSWFQKLDEEPLYSRAWVCQERLLATRNVSFTEHLVFFECAEELSCEVCDSRFRTREGGGFRLGRGPSAGPKPLSLRTIASQGAAAGTAATRDEIHAHWRRIIMFYSSCGITFPTDKLLAIEGVARVFHGTFASAYVAGLWIDDILRDLAWMRLPEPEGREEAADYVAPSWSWASLGSARVFYEERHGTYQPLAECDDVQTTPVGLDPFGQLTDGVLRLRCYAIPLICDENEPGSTKGPGSDAGAGRKDLEPELLAVLRCPSSDLYHRLDTYAAPLASGARYYAVPLYAVDDERNFEFCTTFLLVAPLTPARGCYRRIGLAEVATPARRKTLQEEVIPRRWRFLGLAPHIYPLLKGLLEDVEKVDSVPTHGQALDGRWLITIF